MTLKDFGRAKKYIKGGLVIYPDGQSIGMQFEEVQSTENWMSG